MLITRNIKLSKLKIISSSSTTYYTILQTQTHENSQAVEMYNSFGVTCNNFQTRLSARHSVRVPYHRLHCSSGSWEGLTDQPRTGCSYLVRTAGNTMHCALKDVTHSLAYTLLFCGTFPVEITAGPK